MIAIKSVETLALVCLTSPKASTRKVTMDILEATRLLTKTCYGGSFSSDGFGNMYVMYVMYVTSHVNIECNSM